MMGVRDSLGYPSAQAFADPKVMRREEKNYTIGHPGITGSWWYHSGTFDIRLGLRVRFEIEVEPQLRSYSTMDVRNKEQFTHTVECSGNASPIRTLANQKVFLQEENPRLSRGKMRYEDFDKPCMAKTGDNWPGKVFPGVLRLGLGTTGVGEEIESFPGLILELDIPDVALRASAAHGKTSSIGFPSTLICMTRPIDALAFVGYETRKKKSILVIVQKPTQNRTPRRRQHSTENKHTHKKTDPSPNRKFHASSGPSPDISPSLRSGFGRLGSLVKAENTCVTVINLKIVIHQYPLGTLARPLALPSVGLRSARVPRRKRLLAINSMAPSGPQGLGTIKTVAAVEEPEISERDDSVCVKTLQRLAVWGARPLGCKRWGRLAGDREGVAVWDSVQKASGHVGGVCTSELVDQLWDGPTESWDGAQRANRTIHPE
ncbi:hypothetical protein DFH06DRAFT_1142148 [Mycena polygramma]|nr:hypothetical protein DFH06DRAFT_1142148 [Mycena polygramma]